MKADVLPNPLADKRLTGDEYEWINSGDRAMLVPSFGVPFASPYLYRGQTGYYSPCLPSAFRGVPLVYSPFEMTPRERALCLLRRVRLDEFLALLAEHPATVFAQSVPLVTYPIAIAQHYEIPTDRMDLTQDPEVAAFFATNERGADGIWRPIGDSRRVGIVYRLRIPCNAFRDEDSSFEWIGRQALPRPGEQRAWTLRLPLGCDFNELPVKRFFFRQHIDCSRRLNVRFSAGHKLFPPDMVGGLAREIASCRTASRRTLERVLANYGSPAQELRRHTDEAAWAFKNWFGVTVTLREERKLSAKEREGAETAVQVMRGGFLGRARAVRRVPVDAV